jgi:hypothetical protein
MDIEEDTLYFNPDILVNRFDLLIRLVKAAETISDDTLKHQLYSAVDITIKTIRTGLEDDLDNEVLH